MYRLTYNNDYVINQLTDFLGHQCWVLWSPCGAFPTQPPGLFLSLIFPRVQPHFSHGFQDSCQRATRLLLLLLINPYFIWLPRGWGCPPPLDTLQFYCFVLSLPVFQNSRRLLFAYWPLTCGASQDADMIPSGFLFSFF